MSNRKKIDTTEWQERLQMFSSGNRGRKAAIASQGMTVVENQPFRDIEYDPVRKGNDLVIAVGDADNTFRHTVNAPVEIYIHQQEDGEVSTLEIIDQNGETTLVRLLSK